MLLQAQTQLTILLDAKKVKSDAKHTAVVKATFQVRFYCTIANFFAKKLRDCVNVLTNETRFYGHLCTPCRPTALTAGQIRNIGALKRVTANRINILATCSLFLTLFINGS